MRKNEVEIGETYIAKVSGKKTMVRIDGPSHYGGWIGTNIKTGRGIRIKTAGRLTRILKKVLDTPKDKG